ncbi:MAG: ArsC family reductase [Gammaproteobacteria bacterium]|nr:MAG: ArsC family reductase [Gammaproteobacteria bacterium]
MTVLYGIPNCQTVKKARDWLTTHQIDYIFHDFRKNGLDDSLLKQWTSMVSWDMLLNRRGLTWRKLAPEERDNINENRAILLMHRHPTLIKRPILSYNNHIKVGFSPEHYQQLFDGS